MRRAVFSDSLGDRRVIARGDLLLPTEEIVLEEQERAVVVPALHIVAAAAALDPQASRAVLDGLAARFAVR